MRFILVAVLLAIMAAGCGGGGQPVAKPENTGPTITALTGISDGCQLAAPVTVTAQATDDAAVVSMRLKLCNIEVASSTGGTLSYDWQVDYFKPGTYGVLLIAEDAQGERDVRSLSVVLTHAYDPANLPPSDGQIIVVEPAIPAGQQVIDPNPDTEVVDPNGSGNSTAINVELPAWDESLFDENDSAIPSILISGIKTGDNIHRTIKISAVCSDDCGVNSMGIAIDGEEVCVTWGTYITYKWDTLDYADGPHVVEFYARDNGYNHTRTDVSVVVDNTDDYEDPDIKLWVRIPGSGNFERSNYAFGVSELLVTVEDASPIETIELYIGDELVSTGSGQNMTYSWNTWPEEPYSQAMENHSWDYSPEVRAVATDSYGNSDDESDEFYIIGYRTANCRLWSDNGNPVDYRIPVALSCDTSENRAPDDSYPHDEVFTNDPDEDRMVMVPYGQRTIHCTVDGIEFSQNVEIDPLEATQDGNWVDLRIPAQGHQAGPTSKVAVITGSLDDTRSVMALLDADETSKWNESGFSMDDIVLIDGDNSLSDSTHQNMPELFESEAAIYGYRMVIIEAGNAFEAQLCQDEPAMGILRNWVLAGGWLVVTGQAYDYAERLFPAAWLFHPHSTHFAGPEPLNAAEVEDVFDSMRLITADELNLKKFIGLDEQYSERGPWPVAANWPAGTPEIMDCSGDSLVVDISRTQTRYFLSRTNQGFGKVFLFSAPVAPDPPGGVDAVCLVFDYYLCNLMEKASYRF